MSTTLDYNTNPFVAEQGHLDNLVVHVDVSGGWIDISGACPRCDHFVHLVIPEREFSPDAAPAAPPAPTGASASGEMSYIEDVVVVTHGHAVPPPARKPHRGDRSIALQCNCATTHPDPHSHKPVGGGCGAWFSVTLPAHSSTKHPHLYPGPKLSLYEERNAMARDALAENQLARVRNAAAGWKTGLAALVALIPTLVVVKGADTVDKLARSDAIVVGVLIAVGAVSAVVATLLALRAANGPLSEWRITGDDLRPFREQEVDATISYLRAARRTTIVAAAALAAAIAYAWAAPTIKPYFSVDLTSGAGYCGTLVGLDAKVVQVRTADGITRAIPTSGVKSTSFVSSC